MHEVKKILIEELFRRVRVAWKRYLDLQRGRADMESLRFAYEDVVRLITPIWRSGNKEELKDFLRKEGMPARAILERLSK
ncbi:MAG: hypothetical protein WAP51_01475 [Candidatus Sungiibacteriota bacterium]